MSDSSKIAERKETSPAPQSPAAGSLPALEFKTISTPSGRRGIRMEAEFWTALSDIAARRGVKWTELVLPVIEQAEARGENVTGTIRRFVVMTLLAGVENYRQMTHPGRMIELLQHAPVPAFAMNRQKAVLRANPEFRQYLRVVSGDMKGPVSPEVAQLSVEMPLNELFEALETSSAVQCGVTIRVDSRHRTSLARFVPVPGTPIPAVVGYLVS